MIGTYNNKEFLSPPMCDTLVGSLCRPAISWEVHQHYIDVTSKEDAKIRMIPANRNLIIDEAYSRYPDFDILGLMNYTARQDKAPEEIIKYCKDHNARFDVSWCCQFIEGTHQEIPDEIEVGSESERRIKELLQQKKGNGGIDNLLLRLQRRCKL